AAGKQPPPRPLRGDALATGKNTVRPPYFLYQRSAALFRRTLYWTMAISLADGTDPLLYTGLSLEAPLPPPPPEIQSPLRPLLLPEKRPDKGPARSWKARR